MRPWLENNFSVLYTEDFRVKRVAHNEIDLIIFGGATSSL